MKYHILSIGVSKQQNSSFPSLDYASKDASDFYNLFVGNIGNIGYKKLLTDNEATLSSIRTSFGDELISSIEPDDAFFFLFSGHGAVDLDEEGTPMHFLAPYDATSDYSQSCVSVDYIKEALESIPCKSSFIFIDSCFSGAVNSKSLPILKEKALSGIKSFTGADLGDGRVVFTACKQEETALEDFEYKNSIFTYCLLQELQKERTTEHYPVEEIFTPVTQSVIERAKSRWKHSQTPTINSKMAGLVRLPVFKRPLKLSPEMIQIPSQPQLSETSFAVPDIEIDDKVLQKAVNEAVNLVVAGEEKDTLQQQVIFERFCWKLIKKKKAEWEEIFTSLGSDVTKTAQGVVQLEASCYQLIILAAVVSTYGSKKQMEIFSEVITTIFEWGKGKAGLVIFTTIPEVILVEIIYVVGVVSLARGNLVPLIVLLNSRVDDDEADAPSQPLYMYNYIHYCDALGGSATKVGDHIREILKSYKWLFELVPQLEDKTDDFQMQINYILTSLLTFKNIRFFPDFGRFYAVRVSSLTNKIKYNSDFRRQTAELFGVKDTDIRNVLKEQLEKIVSYGLGGGYFWSSIRPNSLLTPEEREKEEAKAT